MKPRKPIEVHGWDTEDDGHGNPTLFTFVSESGAWYTKRREQALEYLHALGRDAKKRKVQIELWATNLEYDLVNLFGSERIAEPWLRWGRSFLVGARWQGMEFRDTVRHVPLSVAELGELVGLKKLKRDKSVAYGIRDAAITYRAAKELHEVFGKLGQYPRQTLASTALAVWKQNYFGRELYRPLQEIWEAAGFAYYGGRTEAFGIGRFGPIAALDVASMFPWAMRGEFPVPWGPFRRASRDAEIEALGIYRAKISSDIPLPLLPVRTGEGLIYPNGTFEGWYVGEELRYARELGVGVRILEGYEFFETCRPFEGYVADLFALKNSARGPMRTVFKLLLNALYGKFGQKGDKVVSMSLDKWHELEKRPVDFRVWNGLVIFKKEAPPPVHGNNVWPAIVTARARVRLHQEMDSIRAAGGRVYYCDTDSVVTDAEVGKRRRYPAKAKEIGEFELRGFFKEIQIVGKKEYAIWSHDGSVQTHAKGVPFANRLEYLEKGETSFQRPVRIREAARDGAKANVWRTVPKKRRVSFSGRVRKADGTLAPLVIVSAKRKGKDPWQAKRQRKRLRHQPKLSGRRCKKTDGRNKAAGKSSNGKRARNYTARISV